MNVDGKRGLVIGPGVGNRHARLLSDENWENYPAGSPNDGASLTSTAHPKPKTIWARIYWWFRCLRGIKNSSIETVEIEIPDHKH